MITCDLQGGLGAQLFQITATIAYCIQHKSPFIFPYSEALGERPTYWNTFFDKIQIYTTCSKNFPYADPNEIIKFLRSFPKYQEPEFAYNEIPKFNKLILNGHFQSHKYTEKAKDQLFDIMDIKFKQLSIKTEYIELFDHSNMISIHFRVGVYKQEYYHVLPIEYYVNVLSQITMPSKALVFCKQEDNEIIEVHLNLLRNKFEHITFMKVNDDLPDWNQLILQSWCNMNIIANRSFSWWGAYLNKNVNAVFYPDVWFGHMINNNVLDLFPDEWRQTACVKIDC